VRTKKRDRATGFRRIVEPAINHGFERESGQSVGRRALLKAVAEIRSKTELSTDERAFLEYFELMEEMRSALGAS